MHDQTDEASMSIELIDARIKITELTDAVVDVQVAMTGKERFEIMRDWLHEIALKKQHEATLLCKTLAAKGIVKA